MPFQKPTKCIALIPARGGSKGVPRKNLRHLNGKPLVLHTIEAALASTRISDVYLSSDDGDILAVGARAGCKLIRRPESLARDDSTAVEVVKHFLDSADRSGTEDPAIVYLQPTSPLRTTAHIDAAIDVMTGAGAYTLISVTELEKSPFKSFVLDESGRLESLFDEKLSNLGRQALPKAYLPNGAIYIFTRSAFIERGGFPSNGSLPFIMSSADSIDIDTEDDLTLAQRILEQRNG